MDIEDKIYIEIGKNCDSKIDNFLIKNNIKKDKVLMISDIDIWNHNNHFFYKNFNKTFGDFFLLEKPTADEYHVKKIIKKASKFSYIFGFGSGTINDLCKFVAHKNKQKYFILASALSMNGYVSKNASIEINGHKKSLNCDLPIAVYADIRILNYAPQRLTKAGLADVLSFYSCLFDITVSNKIFLQEFHKDAIAIQSKLIKKFEKNYYKYSLDDEKFIKILFQMILNSGWAMTLANSSAPASQSEHLMAHLITMKYKNKFNDLLHGELISLTTPIALEYQLKILEFFSENLFNKILENSFEEIFDENIVMRLENYFDSEIIYECLKEINLKRNYLQKKHIEIVKNIKKNSLSIQKSLSKNYSSKEKISKIYKHFDIEVRNLNNIFNDFEIKEILFFSKLIRNRITFLDII